MADGFINHDIEALVEDNFTELTALGGNLLTVAHGEDVRTIMVTSARIGEGKTMAAISIACTLANHVNSRVALLDANFQRPQLHELFNIDPQPGLSDILLRNTSLASVQKGSGRENLTVIPCGSALMRSIGIHEVGMLKNLLISMRQDFEYVVVDCTHIFGSSDVSLIAPLFEGIIFVIECEKTSWEVVQLAKDNMKNVGGRILGAVLNKRRYYIPRNLYGKI
jgi:protein-tyrosine kinase